MGLLKWLFSSGNEPGQQLAAVATAPPPSPPPAAAGTNGATAPATGGSSPMSTDAAHAHENNRVGPILRSGDVANAAVEAIEIDNPGKDIKVEDKLAYIRISVDNECILKRATMEEMLGRPFEMRELEINLSSFAGHIETGAEQTRFYFNKSV